MPYTELDDDDPSARDKPPFGDDADLPPRPKPEPSGHQQPDKPEMELQPEDEPEVKIPSKPISDMDPPGQDAPEEEG